MTGKGRRIHSVIKCLRLWVHVISISLAQSPLFVVTLSWYLKCLVVSFCFFPPVSPSCWLCFACLGEGWRRTSTTLASAPWQSQYVDPFSLFPTVCIVGPNGVGKSTLLLLLTGKLTPVRETPRLRRLSRSTLGRRLLCLCVGFFFMHLIGRSSRRVSVPFCQ